MLVYYPTINGPTETLVSRSRFELECVRRWTTAGVSPSVVRSLLASITAWLQGVMRQAVLKGQDIQQAVLDARSPSIHDLLGDPLTSYDKTTMTCANEMTRLVVSTTLRELPYWGMSRVRRANAVFEKAYKQAMVVERRCRGGGSCNRPQKRVKFCIANPDKSAGADDKASTCPSALTS